MKTSQKQISLFGEEKSTFLQEDFHVSHTAQPENDLEQRMIDISGRKCLEQFGRFSRHGLWAKTFAGLLIGMEGWYSTRCKLTWKLKGMKYNRSYFQLRVSALPTKDIGFGLLPTVVPESRGKRSEEGLNKRHSMEIQDMAVRGLLPTPRACESVERRNLKTVVDKVENGGDVTLTTLARYDKEFGTKMLPTPAARDVKGCNSEDHVKGLNGNKMNHMGQLPNYVKYKMLPTPTSADGGKLGGKENQDSLTKRLKTGVLPTPNARDYKGGRSIEGLEAAGRNHTNSLPDAFAQSGSSSQLNPRFVAEMMGYPPDWLELPFLNTETNQLKPTGTL